MPDPAPLLPFVTVLANKYLPGYDGALKKGKPSLPVYDDPSSVLALPLDAALLHEWPDDAHVTTYHVSGLEAGAPAHRLNKASLVYYDACPLEPAPTTQVIMLDVDAPEHDQNVWDELAKSDCDPEITAWFDAYADARASSPLISTAGIYSTRGGYRLLWALETPLPPRLVGNYVEQLIDEIEATTQIRPDKACKDWTRLFRLPRVVRDGVAQTPALEDYTGMRPLTWKAPLALNTSQAYTPIHVGTTKPVNVVAPDWRRKEFKIWEHQDFYARIKAGEPLAVAGERHRETFRIVGSMLGAQPEIDLETVYQALYPSYLAMVQATQHTGAPSSMDKLWDVIADVGGREAGQRAHLAKVGDLGKAMIEAALTARQSEDIEDLQKTLELPDAADAVPALKRVVLYPPSGSMCFVWRDTYNNYTRVDQRHIYGQLAQHSEAPLDLAIRTYTKTGSKPLPNAEILASYGHLYTSEYYVYGLDGVHLDKHNNVAVGVAPSRHVKAAHHPDVDQWLRLMGGDHADKLLDWIATCPDLTRPTCALYVEGAAASGKSLLAGGIARLWGSGAPTPYGLATQRFNAGLLDNPVVFADEASDVMEGVGSELYRRLVSGAGVMIEVKFGGTAALKSCPRVILAANNADAFASQRQLGQDDIAALVERTGHIHVSKEAAEYLEALGGAEYIQGRWLDGNGIAEHALWLAANRKVNKGSRYLVAGWETDMISNMMHKFGASEQVLTLIANYLVDPRQKPLGVWGDEGVIYVQSTRIKDLWSTYGDARQCPGGNALVACLKALSGQPSLTRRLPDTRGGTVQARVWAIDPAHVVKVVEEGRTEAADGAQIWAACGVGEPSEEVTWTKPVGLALA